MERQRDYLFDNCKLILILFVVLGHILEQTNFSFNRFSKTIVVIIYSFHMPLFTFISGYFSKTAFSKSLFKSIIKSLLLPYIVFQTLYLIFYELWNGSTSIFLTYTTPFSLLWFIFCLIIWKLLLPLIQKIRFMLALSILVGILAGYISWFGNGVISKDGLIYIGSIYSISRFFVFFPFFLLGSRLSNGSLKKLIGKTPKFVAYILFISIIALIAIFYDKIDYSWFLGRNSYVQLGHFEWYSGLYRLLTYAISSFVCYLFLVISPKYYIPFITVAGQKTMYPYILHAFIFLSLRSPVNYWLKMSEINVFFPILSGCILTMILSSSIIQIIFRPLVESSYLTIFHKPTVIRGNKMQ